jgi:hypothetical protein
MSVRAIAFVEEWVSENIEPGDEPDDNNVRAAALAAQCLKDAKAQGISQAEINDAFDDLTEFMAGELEEAHEAEEDEDDDDEEEEDDSNADDDSSSKRN